MRILLLVFLLTPVFAQSPDRRLRGSASKDPTANSSTPLSYQGCIVRSGGKIMLIDAQNRDYILVSSGRSLENYIGQEVQLSAVSINPNDPTSDEHKVQSGQLLTLDVESVQKVADKCSSPKSTDRK